MYREKSKFFSLWRTIKFNRSKDLTDQNFIEKTGIRIVGSKLTKGNRLCVRLDKEISLNEFECRAGGYGNDCNSEAKIVRQKEYRDKINSVWHPNVSKVLRKFFFQYRVKKRYLLRS